MRFGRRISTTGSVGRFSLSLMLLVILTASASAEPKRVLLLHSFGPQFVPWVYFSGQLRESLIKRSPNKIDLYEASLEGARFQQTEDEAPIIDYLRSLFTSRKLDLIVAMGAPAAFFVQRYRTQFFQETPMIIAAAEQRSVASALLTKNDTFVGTMLDFRKWIENILQVLPDTTHIAWAVGASPLERFWTEKLRQTSQEFAGRVTFEWFNDLPFEAMLKRASVLSAHSAIFYVDLRVDAEGVPLDEESVLPRFQKVSAAPIFSYVDSYLGQGIVGGPLLSSEELGKRIATAAIRILGGEPPSNIKIPPLAMGTPKYDWRELQRWNISERNLPPGSQILFREPGLWDRYSLEILVACGAFLAQASLISWLIHERKRRSYAEAQSRQSMDELTYMNRVAGAGLLSASIAHEVNQPLTSIVTKASAGRRWLAAETPNVDKAKEMLTQIAEAGHRAADIVSSVRAMFTKDTQKTSYFNVNETIRFVLDLIYLDLRKNDIETRINLDEDLPTIFGNPAQVQQVVLNLILNAIEAMSSTQRRVLSVRSEVISNDIVRVAIEDTGGGIDSSRLEQIFRSFYTTKAFGMGMGLSICHSIIENHDGKIWATSGTAGGAIFQFELPARVRPSTQPLDSLSHVSKKDYAPAEGINH